jgi:hypothetical protein
MTCIFLAGALWLYAPDGQFLFRLDELIATDRHDTYRTRAYFEGGSANAPATAAEIVDAIDNCPEGPGITWEQAK